MKQIFNRYSITFFAFIIVIISGIILTYTMQMHNFIATCKITHNIDVISDCNWLKPDQLSIQDKYDMFYRNSDIYSNNTTLQINPFIDAYFECLHFSDSCQLHNKNIFLNLVSHCAERGDNRCFQALIHLPDFKANQKTMINFNNIILKQINDKNDLPCNDYYDFFNTLSDDNKKLLHPDVIQACSKII
jgi:hypothetical protein